jgi:hypothetical protein
MQASPGAGTQNTTCAHMQEAGKRTATVMDIKLRSLLLVIVACLQNLASICTCARREVRSGAVVSGRPRMPADLAGSVRNLRTSSFHRHITVSPTCTIRADLWSRAGFCEGSSNSDRPEFVAASALRRFRPDFSGLACSTTSSSSSRSLAPFVTFALSARALSALSPFPRLGGMLFAADGL